MAEPATLLAFATLRHGGGIVLSVALEHAMRADRWHPEHLRAIVHERTGQRWVGRHRDCARGAAPLVGRPGGDRATGMAM